MPVTVRFQPEGREVRCRAARRLLDAVRSAGLPLASACGAEGLCGRCGLEILDGGRRAQRPKTPTSSAPSVATAWTRACGSPARRESREPTSRCARPTGERACRAPSCSWITAVGGPRRTRSSKRWRSGCASASRAPCVATAHLELLPPSIGDAHRALRARRQPARSCVLPWFLAPGRHTAEDIPREVEAARERASRPARSASATRSACIRSWSRSRSSASRARGEAAKRARSTPRACCAIASSPSGSRLLDAQALGPLGGEVALERQLIASVIPIAMIAPRLASAMSLCASHTSPCVPR